MIFCLQRHVFTIVVFAVILAHNFNTRHQEKQDSYGIFESRQQYFHFMHSVKSAGAANPELMSMVPMINDIVLLQPFGSTSKQYEVPDGVLGLLSNQSVRKELEIIESQFEELQTANEKIQKRFAEQLRQLDLSDMESATEKILAMRYQAEAELQATLLPHQMQRLSQLMARRQLQTRSLVDVITHEPWKTKLNISDEQAKQLQLDERQAEEELQKRIIELRNKARKQILANLKSDQRKQVEEIFGEDSEKNQSVEKSKKRYKK